MKMGYRYTTKYFGNVTDSNTFIPFMLEIADIYEVNSVTIIADKGMSVNRNIRFLESRLKIHNLIWWSWATFKVVCESL